MTLPFAPIRALVADHLGDDDPSDSKVARFLSVNANTVRRARVAGVDDYLADRWCCTRLGLNPASVYGPDWWEPVADDDDARPAPVQLRMDAA